MAKRWLVFAALPLLAGCSTDLVQAQSDAGSDGGTVGSISGPGGSTGASTTSTSTGAGTNAGSGGSAGSTTAPPPSCGNGELDPGEVCDDGNADETDGCTTLCGKPACDDGIVSGGETGLDCGGSCPTPCPVGQGCAGHADCELTAVCDVAGSCRLPQHCRELLDARPATVDGDYALDPDLDGLDPVVLACDMQNGGWTIVTNESFDVAPTAWSDNLITDCGGFGSILGIFPGGSVSRTVDLLGIEHAQVRLQAEFIRIDSWDDETATAALDGQPVWSVSCDILSSPCGSLASECGTFWSDAEVPLAVRAPHSDPMVSVSFSANLDQPIDDEGWGLDDVSIAVF